MATEFLMPKLGLTMEEGTILAWLVPDGAEVQAGMAVMTIETDKVESDVESSETGVLRQLAVAGDTLPCGAVVGRFESAGDAPAATERPASAAASRPAVAVAATAPPAPTIATPPTAAPANGRLFASPNARRVAAARGVDIAGVRGTGPNGRIVTADVDEAADAQPATAPAARAAATPVAARSGMPVPATAAARQLADLLGIDLSVVEPDPVERMVTRDAVARYVRGRLQPAAPAAPTASAAPPSAPLAQQPTSVRPLTGMRGTIAKRMHRSLQEMAQLTLTMDAEMDAVVADRKARVDGTVPGYTDYVVAAVGRALRRHPMLNAQVTADGIAQLPDVHVGLAVALDDGLVVPVVRHADRLALGDIATTTARLAAAARSGSLALADMEGGTCSVSALGMFGVDAFTPVVNPPNAAIVGVGRLREDVVLVDGAVATRTRLTLSLTWDHRVVDGAPAAMFAREIVGILGDPAQLWSPG